MHVASVSPSRVLVIVHLTCQPGVVVTSGPQTCSCPKMHLESNQFPPSVALCYPETQSYLAPVTLVPSLMSVLLSSLIHSLHVAGINFFKLAVLPLYWKHAFTSFCPQNLGDFCPCLLRLLSCRSSSFFHLADPLHHPSAKESCYLLPIIQITPSPFYS